MTDPRETIFAPEMPGALIVAAGYSSRMGAFKPLLPLDGRTILECVIRLFRLGGIRDITVVIGHRADELTPLLDGLAVRRVVNPLYDEGMYSSVRAGFAALPAALTRCFFLPADMPLVRPHTVACLAAGAPDTAPVVYPTFGGQRGHPPLVGRALFAEIRGDDGHDGLKAVLDRHDDQACEIPVFDWGIHVDLDRPVDYDPLCDRRCWIDIPNKVECCAILADQSVSDAVFRHVLRVADVAETIARALVARGLAMDVALVRAGALLHDLAKGAPDHAAAGARIVKRLGFPRVAPLVSCHSDPVVADGYLDERAVVYLADKLVCGEHLVSLDERFRLAMARMAGDSEALRGAARRFQAAARIAAAIDARLGGPLANLLVQTRQGAAAPAPLDAAGDAAGGSP